jgi:two-component system, chemotaxis family, chemotaxis protein CheY
MTTHGRPVLIVDDDLDIREALTDVLEDHGFETITAANGLEALNVLRSVAVTPSAILIDVMMPVMDAYGFLEEYRKDPALGSIPVAIITAGRGVDRSRLAVDAPVVPKPINVPDLVSLLHEMRSSGGTAPLP